MTNWQRVYSHSTVYLSTILLSFTLTATPVPAGESLPMGSAPAPVAFKHFPSRLHVFIWRNWPLVEAERLAQVLETTPEQVRALAESMGLPEQHPITGKDLDRVYITLIRRNWHLLPYEQLLTLLDMSSEKLAYILREDDFLYVKLGNLKPECERLVYAPPSEAEQKRCAEIRRTVQELFGQELKNPEVKRFQFVEELSRPDPDFKLDLSPVKRFSPRYIYSYFALYGDPLMTPELDPYPDGLLQKLASRGVDGVWMHTVLRQLAPGGPFPEFGQDHEIRIKNLRALAKKARKYGMGIYLYMNEPRAMPADFFKNREEIQGVREGDYYTMCTSVPVVRQWISDSLAYVFEQVPELAGVFTISGSENLTHCASHGRSDQCPRCKSRSPAEITAEANAIIEEGVHRGNPNAQVIVWDWGWNDNWVEEAIQKLPKSVLFMSVSEWAKPIERGGIQTTVGEYSLSAVGPGPRAVRHWAAARRAGLKTMAKLQINCTWELSSLPYLPVMDLVAEHCQNLLTQQVDGCQLSWSLGGYPSPNLELVHMFDQTPPPDKNASLDTLARSGFGPEGAPLARQAWTKFSRAFQEYPYHGAVVYNAPVQLGPANLLYPLPTGYSATMVGIPYDDVNGWRGPYPADIFAEQFAKVARGWAEGLGDLEQAAKKAPADKQTEAQAQLRYAAAAQMYFSSVANQVRFTTLRDTLLDKNHSLPEGKRREMREAMRKILRDEIQFAKDLFILTRRDSCIGFEASNHYFYVPVDLMEKAINCQYILDRVDEIYN